MIENTQPSRAVSAKPRFISLRWRLTYPLALMLLLIAMPSAYLLTRNLSGGFASAEDNALLQNSQAVANRTVKLYERLRAEAQRVAFTAGIPEAIRAQQQPSLQAMLESLAATANLDSLIITDATGLEMTGLLRVITADFADYSVSTNTNLSAAPPIQQILGGQTTTSGILRTFEGLLLVVAVPINFEAQLTGVAIVGQRLDTVLAELQAGEITDMTLYGEAGDVLQTTFDIQDNTLTALTLDATLLNQILNTNDSVKSGLIINDIPQRIVYMPLIFGEQAVGVMSIALANTVPYATEIGRQATALLAATLSGSAVIAGFIAISVIVNRTERVTATVTALAHGQTASRTGMKPVDEVGKMGAAVDVLADAMQEREDKFRTLLRRERRERTYLLSVLESLPDGVIVQDKEGRIVVINEHARQLPELDKLIRQPAFQGIGSTSAPGAVLAPGIYTLGNPQQLEHAGKILNAQAAAVMSATQQRLGTVIIVRDVTADVQQAQAREQLLKQLSDDIQRPLAGMAQSGAQQSHRPVQEFAREISRHAAALQKMIVDMRELTLYSRVEAQQKQRPLQVETLVWAVANDWRQIAQAANLKLQIDIGKSGLAVLGDESRLRLAIGNVVDNAIKYTLSGGAVSLEIKDEVNGAVYLRVRDNGVGIAPADIQHLFTPFYRGNPVTPDGHAIRVPGMGQGLAVAKQIIEAHGGILRVKSKPGVGTAVYIALPVTAGVGFTLPGMNDAIPDGATVMLPDNVDIETLWKK
jgi:two-component system sensor histidine kinase VicK